VASLLERTPAFWYQHGVPEPQDPVTRLATLLPTAGILACSNIIARSQASLWPNRPTVALHPCVDTDRFDPCRLPTPKDARRQLGLPEQGPVIGMVARMQRWKGVHVFVRAMDHVRQRVPTASAVIVGGMHALEPDYVAFVDAEINRLGLSQCIHRVGFQDNIPLWMQAMDVVVHASDREPFGMVILEAMALGKPVVAGAEGGPREIITDEVHGLFAPYGDDQRLATQIYRYIVEPGLARRISGNAPRRAADFNRSNYANRLSGAVRELVSGQNPVGVIPTPKVSASDTRVSSIDTHVR
jgi:glycosyltransferase involved in cell wall biosynthesis